MSDMPEVIVRLENPIRLLSAVLSVTDFPERAQARKLHGTHLHARATTKYLQPYTEHPAVVGLQQMISAGTPLANIYALVSHLPYPYFSISALPGWVPPNWNDALADFHETTRIAAWWEKEGEAWKLAQSQSEQMFLGVNFKAYLDQFFGEFPEMLVVMPNISYPCDRELSLKVHNEYIALVPPRLAWGDSAPWPFDEDRPYLHRVALAQYIRQVIPNFLRANAGQVKEARQIELPVDEIFKAQFPSWGAQFIELLILGIQATYLEDEFGIPERRAFVQDQVKNNDVTLLPAMTAVLQRYLESYDMGKYATLADFLPVLPRQLRVTKRIAAI